MQFLSRPLVAATALLLTANSLHAYAIDLVQYGWNVSFPEEYTINVLPSSNSLALHLELIADYTSNGYGSPQGAGFSIFFQQRTRAATPIISLDSITIKNDTVPLYGFGMGLGTPPEPDANPVSFDVPALTNFAADPFPRATVASPTLVRFTGGTLGVGETVHFGTSGPLIMNSSPFTSGPDYLSQLFVLGISPVDPIDVPSPIAIPLPSAVLLMLPALPLLRRIRL